MQQSTFSSGCWPLLRLSSKTISICFYMSINSCPISQADMSGCACECLLLCLTSQHVLTANVASRGAALLQEDLAS